MGFNFSDLLILGVGAGITWFVAWRYYVRAARELTTETQQLRNLHRITLQVLEDQGWVHLNRDESGQPVGMHHELGGHITARSNLTTNPTKRDEIKKD
jgi:hypothetical protein